MYYVSAQGVDERAINVPYYYYYLWGGYASECMCGVGMRVSVCVGWVCE